MTRSSAIARRSATAETPAQGCTPCASGLFETMQSSSPRTDSSIDPSLATDSEVSGPCPRTVVSGCGDRELTIDRYTRAITSPRSLERVTEHFYVVDSADGSEAYHVDTKLGRCQCPDAEYRPNTHCKHAIQAALIEFVLEGTTSEFVARVLKAARRWGCPAGSLGCDGPARPGDSSIPCPVCCCGMRINGTDEYEIWTRLNGGSR